MECSFSTGGGGGTSILEGVITDDLGCSGSCCFRLCISTCGDDLSFPVLDGNSGALGGDAGGNLNSRFIVPLRLFRFESILVTLVERSSWRSSLSESPALSSGVGAKTGRAELEDAAWEEILGGVADARAGAGIEARLEGGLLGD